MRRFALILGIVLLAGFVAILAWLPGSAATRDGPRLAVEGPEAPARVPAAPLEAGESRLPLEPGETERAPAPAVAPAAAADPTESELEAFARMCPAGTIEGILLRGIVPVTGGSAWLGSEAHGGLPWGPAEVWEAASNVQRTEIGRDGLFRFEGLPADTYGVGVRAPDGTTRHVWVTLQEDTPPERIRIVLGTGGIRGHVYDERGGPRAGWQIAAYNWGNTLARVQVIDGRETDATGAFEFAGLVGGQYIVSAGPVADRNDPATRTVSTELAAGEWRTVDFGSPERAGEWTGRVLLPRGKALDIGAMRLDIESGVSTEEANVLPSGEFRVRLAAGIHRVRLRTGQGNTVAFAPVTMPQGDLEQDLVLPPAVLRVRVTREGAPTNDVHLWLASASGSRVRGEWGTDGGILFLGVAPGDYKLTCSPPIRGAVGGQLPVRIGPTDDEVEVDVVVGGP